MTKKELRKNFKVINSQVGDWKDLAIIMADFVRESAKELKEEGVDVKSMPDATMTPREWWDWWLKNVDNE